MDLQPLSFAAWLDDFFAAYYRRRPVNATFIGDHTYDHALPDFSDSGVGDTLAEMEALLQRLQAFPAEKLPASARIDRELAEGFLRIQGWEYRSRHFQGGNPSTYTGEAVFSLISLFLTPFAPLNERVEAAIQRMEAIPAFLKQGQANLKGAPAAWTKRALQECEGALAFLTEGVDWLIREQGINHPPFRASADRAAAAFAGFREFLSGDLLAHPTQEVACGDEALDLMLRQGHFLSVSGEKIAAYARQQLDEAQAYLAEHARDFGASTPQAVLAQLSSLHPRVEGYLNRYQEVWNACRSVSDAHQLLTWPEFPLRYVPRPRWARKAAPYLYFLFYRAPAAFNRPPVHDYLVTPVEPDLPLHEQEKLLQANNDSTIKLNHVVHHGGIGHHVQNWYAYQAASRIGQVAAVDCASRIAMYCGATMAEGWAVYATDLIAETGFLTPLEAYSEMHTRCRMCARAIVDVYLHQGRFTLEEAAHFYEQEADMPAEFATNEAVKNSMFPGAAVIYLMGSERIHQLREELSSRMGSRFNLRQFHDRFLSFGSIPVALIAREMETGAADDQRSET